MAYALVLDIKTQVHNGGICVMPQDVCFHLASIVVALVTAGKLDANLQLLTVFPEMFGLIIFIIFYIHTSLTRRKQNK